MIQVRSKGFIEPCATLLPPQPRRVRYRTWGAIAGIWAIRLFFLPHTFVGIALLGKLFLSLLLAVGGSDTRGQIDRAWANENASRKATSYHIAYTDGTFISRERQADVSKQFFSGLPLEQIRAGTERPDVTERLLQVGMIDLAVPLTDQFLPGGLELKWFFIPVFWNGLLSFFIYKIYVYPYRLRRMYKLGAEATGTVTGKTITRRKTTIYRAQYQFTTPDGRDWPASTSVAKKIYDQTTPGQPIHVLYRPDNPKWSQVYEMGNYDILDAAGEPIRIDLPKQITLQP